jgi:hypothetical protein
MKVIGSLLLILLVTMGIACSENRPAGDSAINPVTGAAISTTPSIPAEARWTLYCLSVPGPLHVEKANHLKEQMIKNSGMRDWYVIHSDQESTLNFGYYRSLNDPADSDSRRAREDRTKISEWKDAAGDFPFRGCMFVPIDSSDPPAPPEWNLLNKDKDKADDDPARAYWTLEIAAYVDSPRRKEMAVESVREARAQGVEAYFFHGPSISSVCIGAWPRDALKRQEQGVGHTETNNPDMPLVVLPYQLPKQMTDQASAIKDAKVLQLKPEIVDPTLLEAMRKYPDHFVNGNRRVIGKYKDPNTGQLAKQYEDSFIAEIPRGQDQTGVSQPLDTSRYAPIVPPSNSQPRPPGEGRQPGTGGLRSLDDQ